MVCATSYRFRRPPDSAASTARIVSALFSINPRKYLDHPGARQAERSFPVASVGDSSVANLALSSCAQVLGTLDDPDLIGEDGVRTMDPEKVTIANHMRQANPAWLVRNPLYTSSACSVTKFYPSTALGTRVAPSVGHRSVARSSSKGRNTASCPLS